MVSGREADAWTVEALPEPIRAALWELTEKRLFKSPEELLQKGNEPWQPDIPLGRIAPALVEKARRTQRAFAEVVQGLDRRPWAELRETGLAAYRREFGSSISGRHWERLAQRIFDRDRGREEFHRLALYLDERLSEISPSKPAPVGLDAELVRPALDMVTDFSKPTPREKAHIWKTVFEAYAILTNQGQTPKAVKRQLIDYLEDMPVVRVRECIRAGLRNRDLLLIVDEAHELFGSARKASTKAARVVENCSAQCRNSGCSAHNSAIRGADKASTQETGFSTEQLFGRVAKFINLPIGPNCDDYKLVAKALLPNGDRKSIEALAAYGKESRYYHQAIRKTVDQALELAGELPITFEHISQSIGLHLAAEQAFEATFAPPEKPSRKRRGRAFSRPLQESFNDDSKANTDTNAPRGSPAQSPSCSRLESPALEPAGID